MASKADIHYSGELVDDEMDHDRWLLESFESEQGIHVNVVVIICVL